jgi:hypothetical protein
MTYYFDYAYFYARTTEDAEENKREIQREKNEIEGILKNHTGYNQYEITKKQTDNSLIGKVRLYFNEEIQCQMEN